MKKEGKVLLGIVVLIISSCLLMGNMPKPPICDQTQGAFCKNTPGSNDGVCETQTKGVCCVFTTGANKDCWDATH
jgi:hypothetical protein